MPNKDPIKRKQYNQNRRLKLKQANLGRHINKGTCPHQEFVFNEVPC